MWGTLFPHSPSCCPSTQKVWKDKLPLKTEAEKLLSTPTFSLSIVTGFPALFIKRVCTLLHLHFLVNTLVEALLVILCVPFQVQLQLYLSLSHPIPTQPNFISRSPVLASTVHAFASFPSVWPAALYSGMLGSCLPCRISCSWGLLALALCGWLSFRTCQLCSSSLSLRTASKGIPLTISLKS